jgi:hypothetical protein
MTRIALSITDEEAGRLAQLAREARTTEEELLRQAVQNLVQDRRRPAIPRFARRVGPLAVSSAPR